MLYTLCNKLISKAEISRVPWKNIPYYSPWSTEEKVEALVFLSKYWQLSALLMKIFWNSQLRALYRLAPGKGQPRSVGANRPSYLNSFFPGTIGTKRLDTTMTILTLLDYGSTIVYCMTIVLQLLKLLPICGTPISSSRVVQCDDHFE